MRRSDDSTYVISQPVKHVVRVATYHTGVLGHNRRRLINVFLSSSFVEVLACLALIL